MIAQLTGTLIDASFTEAIVDVGGVGYQVLIPMSTFDKLPRVDEKKAVTLLTWLQVFSFADIKDLTLPELSKRLDTLWPDILAQSDQSAIELSTEPTEKEKGVLSRIISIAHPDHLNIASRVN